MRTIRYAITTMLIVLSACSAKVINAGSNHPQGPADAAGTGGHFPDDDPCAPVREQALSILQTSCAVCHTGSDPLSAVPGFDILDVEQLVRTTAHGAHFDANPLYAGRQWRYLVPGAPDRSLIEVRIEDGSMPKDAEPIIPYAPPTGNERSVLRDWITSCLGPDPLEPVDASTAAVDAAAP